MTHVLHQTFGLSDAVTRNPRHVKTPERLEPFRKPVVCIWTCQDCTFVTTRRAAMLEHAQLPTIRAARHIEF
jgi:hypothetical protein